MIIIEIIDKYCKIETAKLINGIKLWILIRNLKLVNLLEKINSKY